MAGHKHTFAFRSILIVLAGCHLLISEGQQVYSPYYDSEYKLLIAASQGDTSLIRNLVSIGVETEIRSDIGATPLYYAVTNRYPHAVLLLLELGADPDNPTYRGETPLHAAVKSQDLQMAELLIRNGANINSEDINGATALHYAALYGYYYEADMLIYYDADIESAARDGTTPLMSAVMSGSFDIADILLKEGANVNKTDNAGFSPLLLAAQNGDTLMSELLLLYGASLYATTDDRYNAAAIAIREGHKEYLEYLFTKGSQWSDGNTVNLWRVTELYRRKELVPLLQERKVPKGKTEGLSNINAGISLLVTEHQTFTGISLGTRRDIKGIGIITGVDFKPVKSRVLIMDIDEIGNNTLTQYIDKRNIAYAGAFREIVVVEKDPRTRILLSVCGKVAYIFGNKYPGSELEPEKKVALVPSLSLSYEIMGWDFSIGAEYMKTEVYKSGPVWVRTGIRYNYYIGNVKTRGKSIKWY